MRSALLFVFIWHCKLQFPSFNFLLQFSNANHDKTLLVVLVSSIWRHSNPIACIFGLWRRRRQQQQLVCMHNLNLRCECHFRVFLSQIQLHIQSIHQENQPTNLSRNIRTVRLVNVVHLQRPSISNLILTRVSCKILKNWQELKAKSLIDNDNNNESNNRDKLHSSIELAADDNTKKFILFFSPLWLQFRESHANICSQICNQIVPLTMQTDCGSRLHPANSM